MSVHKQGAWRLAGSRLRIAPSLLSADFGHLADQVARIEAGGAEILHLDIMDGHFVPNISFGIPIVEKLRGVSKLFFDTHLMIMDPLRYAEAFVKAGSDHLTFHIEVAPEPVKIAESIRRLGATVGITLNPATPVSSIQAVVPHVEMVLVMSVWPGFGGQKFIPDSLEKLRQVHPWLRSDQRLEVDGGIGVDTIKAAAQAGADTFVAGSAVFGSGDPVGAMRNLLETASAG